MKFGQLIELKLHENLFLKNQTENVLQKLFLDPVKLLYNATTIH